MAISLRYNEYTFSNLEAEVEMYVFKPVSNDSKSGIKGSQRPM